MTANVDPAPSCALFMYPIQSWPEGEAGQNGAQLASTVKEWMDGYCEKNGYFNARWVHHNFCALPGGRVLLVEHPDSARPHGQTGLISVRSTATAVFIRRDGEWSFAYEAMHSDELDYQSCSSTVVPMWSRTYATAIRIGEDRFEPLLAPPGLLRIAVSEHDTWIGRTTTELLGGTIRDNELVVSFRDRLPESFPTAPFEFKAVWLWDGSLAVVADGWCVFPASGVVRRLEVGDSPLKVYPFPQCAIAQDRVLMDGGWPAGLVAVRIDQEGRVIDRVEVQVPFNHTVIAVDEGAAMVATRGPNHPITNTAGSIWVHRLRHEDMSFEDSVCLPTSVFCAWISRSPSEE